MELDVMELSNDLTSSDGIHEKYTQIFAEASKSDKSILQKDVPHRNHVSSSEIKKLHNRTQYERDQFYRKSDYNNSGVFIGKILDVMSLQLRNKPSGLWYSMKWHWLDWDSLNYEVNPSKEYIYSGYFYEVAFGADIFTDINTPNKDKILSLEGDTSKYIFWEKYKQPTNSFTQCFRLINWIRVAQDYAGIEIPDLTRSNQLKHRWSYGWDVPSGCIWNVSVIEKFKLIK
jgi:hypothetical protein